MKEKRKASEYLQKKQNPLLLMKLDLHQRMKLGFKPLPSLPLMKQDPLLQLDLDPPIELELCLPERTN